MDIISIDVTDESDWFSLTEAQEVAEATAPRDYLSDPDATDELWSELYYDWESERVDPDDLYADLR